MVRQRLRELPPEQAMKWIKHLRARRDPLALLQV
jgi:hypothetical protein